MVGDLVLETFRKFWIYSKCEKIRYYITRNLKICTPHPVTFG